MHRTDIRLTHHHRFAGKRVELVSYDEQTELVTLRDERTGELFTASLEELDLDRDNNPFLIDPDDN